MEHLRRNRAFCSGKCRANHLWEVEVMAASAVPRAGPSSANHVTFSSAIGGVHGAQVWTHIVTGLPALGGLGWVSVVVCSLPRSC